jgi:regulator of RNase E activity RraB
MWKPMSIDFAIAAPSEEAGERIAAEARRLGFSVKVVPDACDEEPDASSWSCYCTKTMIPAYDALLQVQRQLDDIAAPWGGWSDGWGTFGNGPNSRGDTPS